MKVNAYRNTDIPDSGKSFGLNGIKILDNTFLGESLRGRSSGFETGGRKYIN